MSKYGSRLPQLSGELLLTDGGIETTLIFHEGFELPQFAAFDVLNTDRGVETLWDFYGRYLDIATRHTCELERTGRMLWHGSPSHRGELQGTLE